MTIYLVRWPSLTASLVRAENEEVLLDILDQAANPDGCECSVYDGPFAVDFRLPAEWDIRDERPEQPIAPDQFVVGDLGPLARRHVVDAMEVDLGLDAEGLLMAERVLEKAFPRVRDSPLASTSHTSGIAPRSSTDVRSPRHLPTPIPEKSELRASCLFAATASPERHAGACFRGCHAET